jgi:hypothetical protein
MDTRLLVIAAPVLVAATFITLKNNYKARKNKNSLVIIFLKDLQIFLAHFKVIFITFNF